MSPTVRFVDFATRDNNRFIAVCQQERRFVRVQRVCLNRIMTRFFVRRRRLGQLAL